VVLNLIGVENMNTIKHLRARRTVVSLAKFPKRAPATDEGSIPPLSAADVRKLAKELEERARACHQEAAKLRVYCGRARAGVRFSQSAIKAVLGQALELSQQAARNESDAAQLRAEAARIAATTKRQASVKRLSVAGVSR
jgi:hypothetical protein